MTSPTSRTTHPQTAPAADTPPHADKDRARAEHLQEEARRKAMATAQHKESPRNLSAPRYHGGHRGG
ncbi:MULTISPECIES: hypothetical protein [Achromobacter]|jgi:hypothetical protein|uniref:DUF5302 domain-containing protein n=1 Tax=Achromobacter kerstersii TaxID=1353890 RepID=A0A6S6ZHN7_9BURK|nr:hypothetical protein [Achromobacter kerstersii]CAB3676196.1 hypothetical protein LMG3441_01339 [Achromobacter kerstersii]CUJ32381.1 Uncharacterised protein [Achromobacter kerstersii]